MYDMDVDAHTPGGTEVTAIPLSAIAREVR
jgi:hypothetical protein